MNIKPQTLDTSNKNFNEKFISRLRINSSTNKKTQSLVNTIIANIKDVVGAFEIKNGTTSRIRIVLPANGTLDTYLADEGIRCEDDVTVSVTPSVYPTIYIG